MKKLRINKGDTARKQVYNYIREQILSGAIAADQRLLETKIAKDIGTSRTPVREALHSLELEKLVVSVPSVGYVVTSMSEEECKQICQMRGLIEGLAAQWAMENAHRKLVRELSKNIALAERVVSEGNVAGFIDLDAQFHETIARLSGSERLLEMAQMLRRHMLRYRIQSIYLKETALRAVEGHRGILLAIEAGDTEAANRAIRFHLDQSLKDTLRFGFKESAIQRPEESSTENMAGEKK
jgi:DNA-binding GntR family transcriptional regulator